MSIQEELTETSHDCILCAWYTFDISREEAAEVGWPEWDERAAVMLRQASALIHFARHHPAHFWTSVARHPEEALADYEDGLGPYWYAIAVRMADTYPVDPAGAPDSPSTDGGFE